MRLVGSAILVPALLSAGALWAQPLETDAAYSQGLAYMKGGSYQQALERFMDVLLADPDYPEIRARLREAVDGQLTASRSRVDRERTELMREIRGMAQRRTDARSRKAAPARSWERLLREALAAVGAESAQSAAYRYETALENFPVSAAGLDSFLRGRDMFHHALADGSSDGKLRAARRGAQSAKTDPRRLIEEFISGDGQEEDWSYEGGLGMALTPRQAGESASKIAERIVALEEKIRASLEQAGRTRDHFQRRSHRRSRGAELIGAGAYYQRGLRAYALGRLQDAIDDWRECLRIEPRHPEAKRALSRALDEMKP